MANTQEYKFPDEQEVTKTEDAPKLEVSVEGDVELEVVDDVPEADRNRKPLPRSLVDELDNDDLEKYDASVRDRMKQMKKVWHDERRAKEAATREREEALRVAQVYVDENKRLKQYVSTGEQVYAGTLKTSAEAELSMAKQKFREAHEAFDSEALVEAQIALNSAQMKLMQANNFKPTPLQEVPDGVQPETSTAAEPVRDARFEKWLGNNTWYNSKESPLTVEMSNLAWLTHASLAQAGVPVGSDEYYQAIDTRVRKVFPEAFASERDRDSPSTKEPPRRAAPTVVASSSRSSGVRKITLSKSAYGMAKRLGISPEAYATEVMKLEKTNG